VASVLPPLLNGREFKTAEQRLLGVFLTFAPLFVILSISVEGLFYATFSVTLAVWREVESALREQTPNSASPKSLSTGSTVTVVKEQPVDAKQVAGTDSDVDKAGQEQTTPSLAYKPQADDLRIALFFLFFVQVAFFGTGK
jgi:phosphatidylinositol glycan class N